MIGPGPAPCSNCSHNPAGIYRMVGLWQGAIGGCPGGSRPWASGRVCEPRTGDPVPTHQVQEAKRESSANT